MKKYIHHLIAATALIAVNSPVFANECGEPPLTKPAVPEGSTADADDIRAARDAVVSFSDRVDAYLACMDEKAQIVFPYMTKEQKFRWDEDLADIHNLRRDAQVAMNEAIRAYRRSNQ